MIRSGEQYKQSIRDGRVVYIDGERVQDVTTHPSFKPLVDIRARIYDMAHDPATREIMTVDEGGEKFAIALKPPRTQEDWHAKRRAVDRVTRSAGCDTRR
jgi:4-hydroxyphenylacetate 3-monooxygenase